MRPGLTASDDLPWKEAFGTDLCARGTRSVGTRLEAPEGLADGERGEMMQGKEQLAVRIGCAGPHTLGEGSGVLPETPLAPCPRPQPPPSSPESSPSPGGGGGVSSRRGQLQAPTLRRDGLRLGGKSGALWRGLPQVPQGLSSSGTFPGPSQVCSGPAHDQHGTGFSESRQELLVVPAYSYCLGSEPWAAGRI